MASYTQKSRHSLAQWTYDDAGHATASVHAGGADSTSASFAAGNTTVTDALGTQRTYSFQMAFGRMRLTSIQQPCPACGSGGTATTSWTYDANGFVASRTDFNGNVTTYINNSRGLETSRTEASGTPLARTIDTQLV